MLNRWWQRLACRWKRVPARRPQNAERRQALLQLEALEDRIVPTGLVVTDLTSGLTGTNLVQDLLGSGVTASNISLTAYAGTVGDDVKDGDSSSAGEFTGGTGIIGFASGVILSTGGVQNVVGPNSESLISQDNGTAGDAILNGSGFANAQTYDATILQFDFVPTTSTISFNYVFASDEYDEYVDSGFNDAFAFFVNGVNYAVVPGTVNTAVTINTINLSTHSAYYIDNTSGALNTEMDGLTTVLTVTAPVNPGVNNLINMAIADGGDESGDSNVFIQANSFSAVSALSFSTQPPATVAAGSPFSVGVTDLLGGVPDPGVSVTLGLSSNTLNGTLTQVTNASGIATFPGLSVATPGSYTLTATVGANSATSSSFIVPGPGTVTFATQPTTPNTAGTPFSPVVEVVDGAGAAVANDVVSLTMSSGTLLGTTTATTNSSGLATFPGLSVDQAGTYTLTATAAAISDIVATTGTSASFIIVAGPIANSGLTFVTEPSNISAGGTISPAVIVQAVDQYGNPVSGQSVSLSIAPITALSGSGPAVTNAAGQAVFSSLSVDSAGTYTLKATAASATATSSSFIVSPGTPNLANSTLTVNPAVIVENGTSTVTLNVVDNFGNAVPGQTVVFSLGLGGTSNGTFSAVTDHGNGTYTATFTGTLPGTATPIVATINGNAVTSTAPTITVLAQKLSFTVEPPSSLAAGTTFTVTVQVVDQSGNALAEPGLTVTLNPSASTLSGATTGTTNGSGQVVFSGLFMTLVGTYTLTSSSSAVGVASGVSSQFTITAGAAATLAYLSQPSSTTAGSVISPVTVQALDKYDNPVPNATISVSSSPNPLSSGTLSLVSNAAGQVVFNNLVENIAGNYTLTAACTGTTSILSNPFTISAAAAATLSFLSQPSSTTAGLILNAVTVQVVDRFGNDVPNAAISIAIAPGALTTGTTPLTSNAAGQVAFSNLSETTAGVYTLTASAAGTASILSNPFTISAGAAATLSYLSQPSSTTAGIILSAVTVQALDKYDNPVPNASISVSSTPNPLSSGTLALATNAAGQVAFSNLVENVAGNYTLTASCTGTTSILSNPFTISAAAAASLAFLTQPSSTTAGLVLNAVTVQVVDKFGNDVPNASIGIAIAPGTLTTGTTPLVSNAAGQVVFGDLSEKVAGVYTLTASASGPASISSNPFTITPGAAATLAFVSQPTSTSAGVTLNPVTVRATDQYGNTVSSGTAISISLSPGALSAGTTPLATNAVGQVVFNNLVEDFTGTYTLIAATAGVANLPSKSFTITAAAPAHLSYVTEPSSTTAGTTLNSVTVQVVDTFGNLVPGVPIGISLVSGTLSTGTTPLTTGVSGQVSFSDLSENIVGTYTLSAAATGVVSILSSAFVITPAAPATLSYVTEPNSTTAGTTLSAVTVQVADRFGNVVPNVSIGIALAPGVLSTGTTPLVSNAQGQVSFSDLSENLAGTYTLVASTAGVVNALSSSFIITSAAAATLNFLSQPNSVGVNTTINAITLQAFDQYSNLVVGGSVSIALSSGGALNGATTAFTNSLGEVVFSTLAVPVTGLYTLHGTSGSASVVSNPFAVTSSADKLTFVTQPTSTTAGATLNQVVVELTDPAGDLLPGVTLKVALSSSTLGGTTAGVTNSSGQVAFGTLSVTKVGSFDLVATSTGVPSSTSSPFTITAGTPAKISFVTQPSSTSAGTTLSAVIVQAVDQYGNPVSNVAVSIATTFGKLTGTTALTTNTAGQVVFTTLSEAVVGSCALSASAANLSVNSSIFAVTPNAPYALSFVSQPISTMAGAIMTPVSVKVVDKYGNPVPGVAVNLYTSINTISGTTDVTSNAAGLAVFSNMYFTKVATYTLSAGSGTLARPTSNSFIIAPGAGVLSFVTQPVGTTAGSSLGNVTLKLADKYGNPLPNVSVTARLSSGALSGVATAATNSAGQVVFTNLAVLQAGTSYTLTFSAQGAASITSNPFTITAASPPHLLFSTPPTTTAPNTPMKSVTVQLYNSNGTVLDLANVSVTIKISSGSLTGTVTVNTNSSGQAVFSNLEVGSAGSYTFTATALVNGVTLTVTSGSFTVT